MPAKIELALCWAKEKFNPIKESNPRSGRGQIAISAESKEEADRLFNRLSVGGTVEMPMADSPFGYFGMFRDNMVLNGW